MKRIKNAKYLEAVVDLLFDNKKIVTMIPAGSSDLSECEEELDAQGLLLFPSFCDAHTHLREPGQEYKEDIDSGLNCAAHGGFGNILCMGNTKPVNDNASITSYMISRARETHPDGPRLYPVAAATINLDGKEMSPLAEMAKAGAIAVSNDGRPLENTELTRRIMEYASDLGMIFIDHCEDPWLAKDWVIHEGRISGEIGVKGQPGCGESIQAARDILLSEYLNLPVHIAHVSSKTTVDLIKWAKEKEIKVTAETCPHYLVLDDEVMRSYNSNAKMSPPLRGDEDREALREAIRNGIIDILATDHAPHARYEKETVLDAAPFGITGMDLALPLTFQLIRENVISEADLIRLWGKTPARIFGLVMNNFNPGDPADFFLYDPDLEWIVNEETLYSKSANTPFLNHLLKGRVIHHWLDGKKLF